MKGLIGLMLLGVACAYTIQNDNEENAVNDKIEDNSWFVWKMAHNKAYTDANEEKVRYTIWQDNIRRITQHNQQNKNFVLGMNHFGDMTNTEFGAKMNGLLMHKHRNGSTYLRPSHLNAPRSVDWRQEGYVTPVKNQGQCGSCWAFSTTGALEGQHFKKTGKLVSLSEQNLVDCSTTFGNNGCQGGLMDNAFQYIKENGGIDTESGYPYDGEDDKCRFKSKKVGATDTGFVDVKEGDEDALKDAIAANGPVSIAIDASQFSFQFYHSGVYDEPKCNSEQLDHGVLAVGYGTTHKGVDYWIVKNSWAEKWGLKGYIHMSRNKDNQCGVATKASYPLV